MRRDDGGKLPRNWRWALTTEGISDEHHVDRGENAVLQAAGRRMNGPRRRVAITGIGVMAPGGVGVKEFWSLLNEGRTATRKITFFDPSPFRSQVAAEIDFDPEASGLSPQEIRRMDRAAQLAIVATREAVADAGLEMPVSSPERTGVSVGSAVGATIGLEQEYRVVSDDGRLSLVDHEYAHRHVYGHFIPSAFAAEVAWLAGAEGPATVVSTGCTSGLDAVGHAVDLIREGCPDLADLSSGVRRHQGDHATQRRSRACLPPVRPDP
jgi:act minimal PKS ketosynthase (KS/KS alpha)